MSRTVLRCAGVVVVIGMTAGIRSLLQAAPQGRTAQGQTTVATPCVGRPTSTECLIYRLDRIDKRLDGMDALIQELQRRPASGAMSGPQITHVEDQKTDPAATTAYLQQRIDAIAKKVNELVDRLNKS